MSMRSTRVVVGGLLLGLALAACGEESAQERTFGFADEPDSPLRMVDGEPSLTCGNGDLAFPAPALRDGVDGLVDDTEIVAALDALRIEFGIDAPRQLQESPTAEVEWRIVGSDGIEDPKTVLVLLGEWGPRPRPALEYVRFERAGDGWQPDGWGGCRLEPALDSAVIWVDVAAPRGGLASDTSVIDVLVSERECASARDPHPFLREPVIVERERTVTVYWTSEAPTADVTCEGPAPVPAVLSLDKPLGERTLLDGSTWPPRPVRPLPPWL